MLSAVQSEFGKGSTFHFTFKAKEAPELSAGVNFDVVKEFLGMRVLIVDDNATNRRLLTLYTSKWGMVPTGVAAASEALSLLRGGATFELGLIDYDMPEMNGVELAYTMRQLAPVSPLRLVLLSSVGSTKDRREHFDAALVKPIKPSTLFDTLIGLFAAAKRAPTAPELVSAIDRDLGHRHPLRILVVEDNAVNQRLATMLLAKLSYSADMAANGREAIEAVVRQPYDVVLMDLQMPVLDGLAATRELCRRFPTSQRPRIVAMTASAMIEDRQQCKEAGMDDYIDKPVRLAVLARVLAACRPRADHLASAGFVAEARLPDSAPPPGAACAPSLDRAGFRDASADLLRDLRRAADIADGQAGAALARQLRAVCAEYHVSSLLHPLEEIESMAPDLFTRQAIVLVAKVQREHGAVLASTKDSAAPKTQPRAR